MGCGCKNNNGTAKPASTQEIQQRKIEKSREVINI